MRKFYVARVLGDVTSAARPAPSTCRSRKGRKSRYRVAAPRERIARHGSRWHLERTTPRRARQRVARFVEWVAIGRHTLLALQPLTGRTHQLRVHLAWIGHPILGDHLYGKPDAADQRWPRLALHCHRIVVDGLAIERTDAGGVPASVDSTSNRAPRRIRPRPPSGCASTRVARLPPRAPRPNRATAGYRGSPSIARVTVCSQLLREQAVVRGAWSSASACSSARLTRRAIHSRHVEALTGPELFLAADVLASERRVVQHPAVAQRNAPVHDEAFAARHDVSRQISTHIRCLSSPVVHASTGT